jgi:hypothetical protein
VKWQRAFVERVIVCIFEDAGQGGESVFSSRALRDLSLATAKFVNRRGGFDARQKGRVSRENEHIEE